MFTLDVKLNYLVFIGICVQLKIHSSRREEVQRLEVVDFLGQTVERGHAHVPVNTRIEESCEKNKKCAVCLVLTMVV